MCPNDSSYYSLAGTKLLLLLEGEMFTDGLPGKLGDGECSCVHTCIIVLQVLSSQRRDDVARGLAGHSGVNRRPLSGLGA